MAAISRIVQPENNWGNHSLFYLIFFLLWLALWHCDLYISVFQWLILQIAQNNVTNSQLKSLDLVDASTYDVTNNLLIQKQQKKILYLCCFISTTDKLQRYKNLRTDAGATHRLIWYLPTCTQPKDGHLSHCIDLMFKVNIHIPHHLRKFQFIGMHISRGLILDKQLSICMCLSISRKREPKLFCWSKFTCWEKEPLQLW